MAHSISLTSNILVNKHNSARCCESNLIIDPIFFDLSFYTLATVKCAKNV